MFDFRFNPAEAEDGFRRSTRLRITTLLWVSIQPKPKTGLEETEITNGIHLPISFNPAEAEDGFRRLF